MDPYIQYSQTTGSITYYKGDEIIPLGKGWAGNGLGKNNSNMQAVRSVGPLPQGWYSIGEPHTHPTVGPFAMRLTPEKDTEMFGRDGFLIHGPSMNAAKYGEESRGCIVAMRPVREKIHSLVVHRLEVVK
jgi:hypothetical protein